MGAGMVQASQVQLQTPRDEEEEEHGRSQVSGRAGCGPRTLTSRWRRSGKCGSTSAFVLTGLGAGPAWAVLREVVRRTPGVAGRGLETWHFCPGFDRCLLSASCPCPPSRPRMLVLFAKHPPVLVLCCLQSASRSMPRRRPGNLGFGAFVGNTVFSVKIRRPATPGKLHQRLCSRGDLRSLIFTFYETILQRHSWLLPEAAPKGRKVCCPGLHSRHRLEPMLPSLSFRCRLSQLRTD